MHKEAVAESVGSEMTSKCLLRVFPVVLALGYRFRLELLLDCAEISALHSSHSS